jgi:hypothetical protein
MTTDVLLQWLGWMTVINASLLSLWVLAFVWIHDWMYRLHSRWFRLTPERFDAIHYGGMALFKMAVMLFNLVPYLALRLLL